ncbi:MAG: 2-phospho-L-lactate guanylyltransferase [Alphaproteobacteria bacterium]|nr:2-phospho-L-lactate guanylyltransferase [Alphaproteobacteria bacterium]
MNWIALIPVKEPEVCKTRLAEHLSSTERARLCEQMLAHVLDVLSHCPGIGPVVVLSRRRPVLWTGAWIVDEGRGLNEELTACMTKLGGQRIAILHSDLPLLCVDDVTALIEAAELDPALAQDRHGSGTNAFALPNASDVTFAFGQDSLRRHQQLLRGRVHVVKRPGLALDIDTPADLVYAEAQGFHRQ